METATVPTFGEILRDPNLRLSAEEVHAAELHAKGRKPLEIAHLLYPEQFADAAEAKPSERRRLRYDLERRVRWALERVAQRVSEAYPTELREAGQEFSRVLLDAVANRREGRAAQPIVGILPYLNLEDQPTPEAFRALVSDPKNYLNVSLRSPIAGKRLVRQTPVDALGHLARSLRAEAELAREQSPVPAVAG